MQAYRCLECGYAARRPSTPCVCGQQIYAPLEVEDIVGNFVIMRVADPTPTPRRRTSVRPSQGVPTATRYGEIGSLDELLRVRSNYTA